MLRYQCYLFLENAQYFVTAVLEEEPFGQKQTVRSVTHQRQARLIGENLGRQPLQYNARDWSAHQVNTVSMWITVPLVGGHPHNSLKNLHGVVHKTLAFHSFIIIIVIVSLLHGTCTLEYNLVKTTLSTFLGTCAANYLDCKHLQRTGPSLAHKQR